MESLQGLLLRLLLGVVTKRQNYFHESDTRALKKEFLCDVRTLEHMFFARFKIFICLFACLPSWVIFFLSYYPVFLEFKIGEIVMYVFMKNGR